MNETYKTSGTVLKDQTDESRAQKEKRYKLMA
jgi:hypothetical protein